MKPGESIRGPDGETAYLKTFRLSDAQVRRGHLLDTLDRHDWDLEASAQALEGTRRQLVDRLEQAGFGEMLREYVRVGS